MCVTGPTERVVGLEPLEDKWRSFGWDAIRIDGHSHAAIAGALAPAGRVGSGRPLVVIADTVKGKGIPSISNRHLWHGVAPAGAMAEVCRRELERTCRDE
jgi:transketolase